MQGNHVVRSPSSFMETFRRHGLQLLTGLAGQEPPTPWKKRSIAVGIKEVDDRIWLVTFMDDLGYIDREEKNLQPLNNAFGPKA